MEAINLGSIIAKNRLAPKALKYKISCKNPPSELANARPAAPNFCIKMTARIKFITRQMIEILAASFCFIFA